MSEFHMSLRESTINREYRKISKAQAEVIEKQNVPKKHMPKKKGKRKRQQRSKTRLNLKEDVKTHQLFDLSAALEKLSDSHSLLLEDKERLHEKILFQDQSESGVILRPNESTRLLKRKFYELGSDDDSSFDKITSEFKKLKITDHHESARIQRDSKLFEKLKAIIKDNQFTMGYEDPETFEKQILRLFQEFEICRPSKLLKPEWMKHKLQYSLEACFDSSELDLLMLQINNSQHWSNSSNSQLLSSLIFDMIEEF